MPDDGHPPVHLARSMLYRAIQPASMHGTSLCYRTCLEKTCKHLEPQGNPTQGIYFTTGLCTSGWRGRGGRGKGASVTPSFRGWTGREGGGKGCFPSYLFPF